MAQRRRLLLIPSVGLTPVPGGWRENPLPTDFSVDASVRIEADDRAGLERRLRYCARSPFALDRLEAIDVNRLMYHLPKPQPNGRTVLMLTPLERIDRLVALIPPPHTHRHRYHGVLAPNAI